MEEEVKKYINQSYCRDRYSKETMVLVLYFLHFCQRVPALLSSPFRATQFYQKAPFRPWPPCVPHDIYTNESISNTLPYSSVQMFIPASLSCSSVISRSGVTSLVDQLRSYSSMTPSIHSQSSFAGAPYGGEEARPQTSVLITLGNQSKTGYSLAIDHRGRVHCWLRGSKRRCLDESVSERDRGEAWHSNTGDRQRGSIQP